MTRAILTLGVLALALGLLFPIASSPKARAEISTGWYEQESGVTVSFRDVSAVDSNTAWAVGQEGTIVKTTDGGATWTPQASGTTKSLYDISAVDSQTAWAVGASGTILKTSDGGVNWTPQVSGTTNSLSAVSAVDSQTAWAVGAGYYGGSVHGLIFKTVNGGSTWNPQESGTVYGLLGVSAVDSQTAWSMGFVILKTTDGGSTWNPQNRPSGSSPMSVSAVDSQTAWAAGSGDIILKTTDGGTTWISLDLGTYENLELNSISAVDSQTAWAVGGIANEGGENRLIFKTSDGGAVWECQVYNDQQLLYGGYAVDADTAWAVGNGGTILRTDGGGMEYNRYFAEGYTGPGFQEYFCLGNPRNETAHTTITYMFPDGTVKEQRLQVPPLSRITIDVNSEVGEGKEISAKVVSDKEIIAERPMYFSYQGKWAGGSVSSGAVSPSSTWYFAEGYTGTGFDEWICVQNPGEEKAYMEFSFQTQEEGKKKIEGLSVPAHSRNTFKANDLLGGEPYQTSLWLSSSCPIVAERAMYFDYTGTGNWHWTGGSCVIGSNILSKEYYFAEGTTRAGFDEWFTLQNALGLEVTVEAEYHFGEGGDPVRKTYELPGFSRRTIFIPAEVGEGKDVSVKLTSDRDFLAERPMYFSYSYAGLAAKGGDCVMGAPSPASEWFFAEGYTGPGFQEWLCLQNPGDTDATVEIIYYTKESGALPAKTETISAKSRKTIMVNEHAGAGYSLSTRVKVISGPDIVAERPMYFIYNGWDGGHDVVGYTP